MIDIVDSLMWLLMAFVWHIGLLRIEVVGANMSKIYVSHHFWIGVVISDEI